jgi:hypothetical protein
VHPGARPIIAFVVYFKCIPHHDVIRQAKIEHAIFILYFVNLNSSPHPHRFSRIKLCVERSGFLLNSVRSKRLDVYDFLVLNYNHIRLTDVVNRFLKAFIQTCLALVVGYAFSVFKVSVFDSFLNRNAGLVNQIESPVLRTVV